MGIFNFIASIAKNKKEKEWAQKARIQRESLEQLRLKLQFLRISNETVKKALQGVVLVTSQYLQVATKADTWDPECHASVEACRDLMSVYQKELDERSVEQRFHLDDANPLQNLDERVLEGLRHHTALLREGVLRLGGDVPGTDHLSIEEELR